ncbi:MAG: 4-hydroxy-tetrahydrodipicolinate reductase [Candidatus Dormibacter sp.]|uniref:4-hydroxy-tetrahydrodipicolinate reductase n=1 Tax=Candidatus Dormibacter sp. TaxID=2973982 RepID=UPI000DB07BE7|nr:MAG: 4-hydroxy-tetrahydrodipicolinate reductase [Candidatus Dormibacteraeota bacterium]
MIKVLLSGHRGRAGSAVASALNAAADVDYVGGCGREDDLAERLAERRPEVMVDFSLPGAALANGKAALAAGAAPLIGTSGLSDAAVAELEAGCAEARVGGGVIPNFAVGAVVMMWLAEQAAAFFEAAELVETHDSRKLDAPSGTALATAKRLAAAGSFSYRRPEKVALPEARGGELGGVGVHSLRLPGVMAEQEVLFGLAGQTLTIGHRVYSRDAYGPGVLLAVRQIAAEQRFYRGLEQLLGLSDRRH